MRSLRAFCWRCYCCCRWWVWWWEKRLGHVDRQADHGGCPGEPGGEVLVAACGRVGRQQQLHEGGGAARVQEPERHAQRRWSQSSWCWPRLLRQKACLRSRRVTEPASRHTPSRWQTSASAAAAVAARTGRSTPPAHRTRCSKARATHTTLHHHHHLHNQQTQQQQGPTPPQSRTLLHHLFHHLLLPLLWLLLLLVMKMKMKALKTSRKRGWQRAQASGEGMRCLGLLAVLTAPRSARARLCHAPAHCGSAHPPAAAPAHQNQPTQSCALCCAFLFCSFWRCVVCWCFHGGDKGKWCCHAPARWCVFS